MLSLIYFFIVIGLGCYIGEVIARLRENEREYFPSGHINMPKELKVILWIIIALVVLGLILAIIGIKPFQVYSITMVYLIARMIFKHKKLVALNKQKEEE